MQCTTMKTLANVRALRRQDSACNPSNPVATPSVGSCWRRNKPNQMARGSTVIENPLCDHRQYKGYPKLKSGDRMMWGKKLGFRSGFRTPGLL